MKKLAFLLMIAMSCGILTEALAQNNPERIPPRKDDHFWRRKVVLRIDLEEKINRPFIEAVQSDIYAETGFSYNNGIIASLMNGLKEGRYLAYHPDDLNKSLDYGELENRIKELDPDEDVDPWETDSETEWEDIEGDNEIIDGDISEGTGTSELWEGEAWEPGTNNSGDGEEELSLAPYETVMEIVEERIFDKNRSDMVYNIQYIRVVWVDPAETLPDQLLAVFKYEDVKENLESTRYANAFNEAETRNLKEILDLRIFNSYVINVSGRGVKSMGEAEYRRNQLTEYEHNLWSY